MSERFNKPSFNLINYNIYAVCGDGCIMEGLTAEAASLAGHLGLENLCWIYDNNNITIEGNTNLSFSEDIYARFKSYNWNVETIKDANNLKQLRFGYKNFLKNNTKPTLLIINSEIGFGSPNKQGFSTSHGKPLGEHECELTKKNYKWPYKQPFKIPNKVLKHFKNKIFKRGTKQAYYWYKLFTQYTKSYPTLAKEFTLIQKNILPKEWYYKLNKFKPSSIGIATRVASGKILNIIGKNIPWLIGGSADLNTSTNTLLTFKNSTNFSKNNLAGRNLYFGIRENCMASVLNGLALTKIRAYGATFLTFMDYLRPGLRLSALMEINPIYIFTHDSISIGEDGPTHQPIEHLSNLRALPRLITFRPADANEVIECWKIIIKLKHNPSALILTRQKLPILDRNKVASESGVKFGGYILLENKNKKPEILLLSTGSEVHLCVNAFYNLKKIGINARIISMPSFEIFEKQDTKYKNYIIPKHVKARIAIEQANSFGWERYIGDYGTTLSINNFGKSAPSKKLQNYFGFNAKTIIKLAINQLKKI